MKKITLSLDLSENEYTEISTYFRSLPATMLLFGLRFRVQKDTWPFLEATYSLGERVSSKEKRTC